MIIKSVFQSLAASLAGLATFGLGLALGSLATSSTPSKIMVTALASGMGFAAGGFVFTSLGRTRPLRSGALFSLVLAGCSTTYIFGGQARQFPWMFGFWLAGMLGVWLAIRMGGSSPPGSAKEPQPPRGQIPD